MSNIVSYASNELQAGVGGTGKHTAILIKEHRISSWLRRLNLISVQQHISYFGSGYLGAKSARKKHAYPGSEEAKKQWQLNLN